MSVEAISATGWLIAKILAGAFLGAIGWFTATSHKKLQDTYSKKETEHMIDLKVEPVKQACDSRTDAIHDKFDTLMDLVKSNNLQNTVQRKENNDMLHEIKVNVAVLSNKIENIQEMSTREKE